MKEMVSEILDELYVCLKYSLRDITLFPGDNLVEAFQYAIGITVISILSSLLALPTFLDWRGGIAGSCIIGLLILIGRREGNALSGDDGNCNDGSRVHASGEENAGKSE